MPDDQPVQIDPRPGPIDAKPGMTIQVIETVHTTVMRQAAPAEDVTVCCEEFAGEYGTAFRLLPDGGLVPEALRLYRVKLGREQYDKPRLGWKFCPRCGLPIATAVEVIAVGPPAETPAPLETGNQLAND